MSQNKHYREAWIIAIYAKTVALFHEARKEEQNADVPLADLARQCANTLFQEHVDTIVGDPETLAKAFMAYCREHFATEIQTAIAERAQADIEKTQTEEREALVA